MYKIKLPNFEGPFDLLLYFIRKDEVNIYDIPIAKIAREFLSYLGIMKHFDIELASEFILMAANLMYIKSQMMLPKPNIENGEEYEDPRTQLVQRLLEYRQIKESAKELEEHYENQRYTYYRNIFDADVRNAGGETYKNTGLFDLMRAYQKVMEKKQEDPQHIVVMPVYSTQEKMHELCMLLSKEKKISFYEYVANTNKLNMVVTFLAILNLLKERRIYIRQEKNFDDIIIFQYQNGN